MTLFIVYMSFKKSILLSYEKEKYINILISYYYVILYDLKIAFFMYVWKVEDEGILFSHDDQQIAS
jgi:hypothetical protein